MKALLTSALATVAMAATTNAQTYLYDFQEQVGLETGGVYNRTIEKTTYGNYLMAVTVESPSSSQNKLVIYQMDPSFGLSSYVMAEITLPAYGGTFEPNDIIEGHDGTYVICGEIIQEGAGGGGFLMSVKSKKGSYTFDWLQVYPNSNAGGMTEVATLKQVVKTHSGYMAIAAGSIGGIVMGTDQFGDPEWSHHVYDNQYPLNHMSQLNDIVSINEEEAVIVGTVNSHTWDDADIMVVKMNANGDVIKQRVYERAKKEYADGQSAYKETGNTITYNKDKNALAIAGVHTKKPEAVCTDADYIHIIGLEVDYNTLDVNWTYTYDIGIEYPFTQPWLFCSDIAYNADKRQYGIVGYVKNDLFGKTLNYNSFFLELEDAGPSTTLRYYGDSGDDFLHEITTGDVNSYVLGGTYFGDEKNNAWIVESYQAIEENCRSVVSKHKTLGYKLQDKEGKIDAKEIGVEREEAWLLSPIVEEKILCESIYLGKAQLTASSEELVAKEVIEVYPTVVENGMITVINNAGYTAYNVYPINGSMVIDRGLVQEGTNQIALENLSPGLYLITFYGEGQEMEQVKLIVK